MYLLRKIMGGREIVVVLDKHVTDHKFFFRGIFDSAIMKPTI